VCILPEKAVPEVRWVGRQTLLTHSLTTSVARCMSNKWNFVVLALFSCS